MSHRDQRRHNALPSYAQDLREVFQWLLAGTEFRALRWRRDSSFSPRGLVLAALLWVWSEESTLTHRFQTARQIARRLWPRDVPARVSYQAFLKLLVRWSDLLLVSLKQALRQRLSTTLKARFRLAGFCVFGVDGSRLELPRTASNAARFAPEAARSGRPTRLSRRPSRQSDRSRRKKGEGPQLWITTLWHAGTGLVWDWRIGPSDSSERDHLRDMLDQLPPDSLLTADAGFVGYDTWQALLAAGYQFVIRVGGNVRLLQGLGFARESAGTVSLWPDQQARRHAPPLVLRLVVVHDGRQPWYLVTSVRSTARLSDRQVAEIYRRRWGIELFYRHFKQTFGRRKLRSHTAEHVRCEAHWTMLGLNALLLHAVAELHRHRIPPARLSVAQALRAYRTALRNVDRRADPGESLGGLLARSVIDDYVRTSKRSRDYPRKRYEPPTQPPTIQPATRQQRLQAKDQRSRKRLTA